MVATRKLRRAAKRSAVKPSDEEAGFPDCPEESIERETLPPFAYLAGLLAIFSPVAIVVGLLQDLNEVNIPLYLGIALYVVYLAEAFFFSKTSKYLTNVMNEEDFARYLLKVQKAAPSIGFTIQNWHYETHTTTDNNGNTQTSQHRVDTHTASKQYDIVSHLDETLSPMQTLAMFHLLYDGSKYMTEEEVQKKAKETTNRLILLCHMPLVLHPVSHEDHTRFLEDRAAFYAGNTTDMHQDKGETRGLTCAYHERVMVILSGGTNSSYDKPWWMNCGVFVICTFFLMSVPYRLYFFSKCQLSTWPILKHFSHRVVAFDDEIPVKSRQHGSSAASRAFKALQRETPTTFGRAVVDASGSQDGGGPAAALKTRSSELVLADAVPSYWTNRDLSIRFDEKIKLPGEEIPKFQKLLDNTFKDKATKDRKSGEMPKRLKVEQVLRMEDSVLWNRFLAKRAELAAFEPTLLVDLPGSGAAKTARPMSETEAALLPDCLGELTTEINEAYLFHGSAPAGALGIGEDGFDMSKVGSNVGTMFGGGAYMAEASSKSDEYAKEDGTGVFAGKMALLLCRTLLGNMFYITESNIPKIEEALATMQFSATGKV
eukprot:TRINITY_DN15599_c0_g1_i6.p1 TRINITY_DN15599_c0_g1~~TRINITY_DN15599_c0_g1_i6.p1  ORF type:complete len:600 (-),score=117.14 TRINITY_DN15599_c0_g1_i6:11-1810(-)